MQAFDQLLEQEIAQYEGRHDDVISQAPALYRLLTHLLDDSRVTGHARPLVAAAIAYFILPADVIPEEIYGPYGYADDIWLCAWVADAVRRDLGEEIIMESWDGECPLPELVREILDKEQDLIGEEREKILRYTGCDQLV
jgi:uncharacterized membrane protein YkvA (DUF1232 family)